MKEAMYRGPSASSLANSASSTDTLLATGTNAASASAPDLASKGQALPPQYRWGLALIIPRAHCAPASLYL